MKNNQVLQYLQELKKGCVNKIQVLNRLFILFEKKIITVEEFNLLKNALENQLVEENNTTVPTNLENNDLITENQITDVCEIYDKYNTSEILELDFSQFPYLNYNFYKNGKYLQSGDNPYFFLVQAIGDENECFEIHNETKMICFKAFKGYYSGDANYNVFKRIILHNNIDCNLQSLYFLNVEELYLYGDNDCFYSIALDYLKNLKYIYAPNLLLSEINYKETKNKLTAGYLLYKEENSFEQNIKNEYELYIKNRYKNFYSNLDNEILLNYLLSNKLINENDLYDLLKTQTNEKVLNKLEEYSKQFNFNLEKDIKLANELYDDLIVNNTNSNNTQLMLITNKKFENKKFNTQYQRKVQTFWRENIHIGDIFYCVFNDSLYLLRAHDIGTAMRFNYYMEVLSDEEINYFINTFHLKNNDKINQLIKKPNLTLKINDDTSYELTNILNRHKSIITLHIDYGVFKHVIFDGKLIELPDIQNKKSIYFHKQLLELFECYFEFVVNKETNEKIYFRKLNLNYAYDQIYKIPNILLSRALDLRTSIANPYKIIKRINDSFINEKGNVYNIIDVIKFINQNVAYGKNDANFRNIQVAFSDFYQQTNDFKFEGFTSKDIKFLLDKYFAFDYALGFYYGWDTIEIIRTDALCYDKRWFKVFYQTVRKNKKLEINSCNDLDLLINNNDFLEFNKYVIDNNYVKFFIELAKKINSFEKYIDIIKPYLLKILNYN